MFHQNHCEPTSASNSPSGPTTVHQRAWLESRLIATRWHVPPFPPKKIQNFFIESSCFWSTNTGRKNGKSCTILKPEPLKRAYSFKGPPCSLRPEKHWKGHKKKLMFLLNLSVWLQGCQRSPSDVLKQFKGNRNQFNHRIIRLQPESSQNHIRQKQFHRGMESFQNS